MNSKDKDMNLFGHLAELHLRLIRALAAVALGCLLCWNFAEPILGFVLRPAAEALPEAGSLIFTGLQDAFMVTLKTSLWAGTLASAPLWLYQLWAFVAPALYPDEKKTVLPLAFLGTALLIGGAAFAYFLVFPMTFKFLLSFAGDLMQPLPAVDRYLSLAMSLILAFALAFQLPLVLMFLGRMGFIDAAFLRRNRVYAVLTAFVLGAVLTPPDVASQVLLAVALLLLYELSIFLIPSHRREETK